MTLEAIEKRVKKIIENIDYLIDRIRDTENYEKGTIRKLIESEYFQVFLEKLQAFLEAKEYKQGWETSIEYTSFPVLFESDATIIKQNNRLVPGFIVDEGYWNQYHSLWYFNPTVRPVETLQELLEWFKTVREELEVYFTNIVYRIKNSVKELQNL